MGNETNEPQSRLANIGLDNACRTHGTCITDIDLHESRKDQGVRVAIANGLHDFEGGTPVGFYWNTNRSRIDGAMFGSRVPRSLHNTFLGPRGSAGVSDDIPPDDVVMISKVGRPAFCGDKTKHMCIGQVKSSARVGTLLKDAFHFTHIRQRDHPTLQHRELQDLKAAIENDKYSTEEYRGNLWVSKNLIDFVVQKEDDLNVNKTGYMLWYICSPDIIESDNGKITDIAVDMKANTPAVKMIWIPSTSLGRGEITKSSGIIYDTKDDGLGIVVSTMLYTSDREDAHVYSTEALTSKWQSVANQLFGDRKITTEDEESLHDMLIKLNRDFLVLLGNSSRKVTDIKPYNYELERENAKVRQDANGRRQRRLRDGNDSDDEPISLSPIQKIMFASLLFISTGIAYKYRYKKAEVRSVHGITPSLGRLFRSLERGALKTPKNQISSTGWSSDLFATNTLAIAEARKNTAKTKKVPRSVLRMIVKDNKLSLIDNNY